MTKSISILITACLVAGSLTLAAAGADNAVALTGDDTMQFNVKEFTVTSGTPVKLSFKHVGKLPKEAMGHNVVILKQGVDVDKFAQEAAVAATTGFIPPSGDGDILAKTKLIGGGEEDTITFTAPAPGHYTYICTFPGHFALMRGIMRVK